MTVAPALYTTRVSHRRPGTPAYRFAYRSFYVLFNVDAVDQATRASVFFSHNCFNLLSFHDRDHGPHDGTSLRAFVDARLVEQGLDTPVARVELLAMPRVFGYAFHPVSFYYCYRADDRVAAVLVEVHNTFGEHHFYVLHDHGQALAEPVTRHKAKCFQVSPFLDRAGEYAFCLHRPGRRVALGIRLFQDDTLKIATGLAGGRRPLTSATILRVVLTIPLMTVKVTAAIYWQAFKLWRRGARVRRKPVQAADRVS